MCSDFSTNYNQEYQTMTDLLSKIGGLFQSVVSIVGLIITYYNKVQLQKALDQLILCILGSRFIKIQQNHKKEENTIQF
ncbi:unnamed protein product [Paramecium sonneborni]|uniref:Uncharacterized protein n=1 Tax=Paramecium sonneborni TaxID=65129 RepID=A0A8S1RM58_9CILI|nr:unnamed protein product [Paramecium sonneborni]